MLKKFLMFLILIIALAALLPVASADQPVVHGIFFYSPTCPHCRDVLENHWPGIEDEFGSQLRVLFVNTSTESGAQFMWVVFDALGQVPGGVPALVIGRDVLVGSIDIPMQAPGLIRRGLASGGVDMLPIDGLASLYDAQLGPQTVTESAPGLLADPANLLAIGILVLLLFGLAAPLVLRSRVTMRTGERITRGLLVAASLVGLGMAFSLLAGWQDNAVVLALAAAEMGVFFLSLVIIAGSSTARPLPGWLIPVIALAGLGVAAYLAYVEITTSDAVCGVVGNCNVVQQSDHARLFNIPIGLIGVAGYTAMILVWLVGRGLWARRALVAMSVLGVAFSAYLTFLEPFVIGASCVWCLTSAVIMLMMLWMTLPSVVPQQAA